MFQAASMSNSPSKDPMAALAAANPALMLSILSLGGQDLTGCLSNCSNNGLCGLDQNNKFDCKCQEHFVGGSCQTDTRACSYFPCQNEGNCTEVVVPDSPNTFNCSCDPALFYGTRCEFKVDLCAGIKCSNHGKCFDVASVPTCKCFANFNGTNCEIKSATLRVIESAIQSASIVAITFLTAFFVSLLVMDYLTYMHSAVIKILFQK